MSTQPPYHASQDLQHDEQRETQGPPQNDPKQAPQATSTLSPTGRPRIGIGTLGGTIAMAHSADAEGIEPQLGANELIAQLPELEGIATVESRTLCNLPSIHLQYSDLMTALAWAEHCVQSGASGVVLTQGTDTLEESAFLLDLLWPHPEPLVLTGAMRGATALSADGPANLINAVRVASSDNSRHRGVLVVMNDEIHYARWVHKAHTLNLAAFESPMSLAGVIIEEQVRYVAAPPKRLTFARPTQQLKRVLLWTTHLGEDGLALDALMQTYDGVVFAGVGSGHVSPAVAQQIATIAPHKPILISSGIAQGGTSLRTYNYAGSEIDLQAKGAIMTGLLSAKKARLLLWLLLNNGEKDIPAAIRQYLDTLSY